MKIIILFAASLIFISSFAQSNLKPGFIVKNTGDTVRGLIEEVEVKKLSNKISFSSTNAQTGDFTTSDINGFGYDGGNSFQKIFFTSPFDSIQHECFAETLSIGYYSLYTFWIKEQKYFAVKTPEDVYRLLTEDERSANGYINQKGNFQNELLFISQSCLQLRNQLEGMNYTESDLIAYITKLNKCVAPTKANTVTYKKGKSELNIYAYVGGIAFGSNYEYTGRIIAKLTVPSVDKDVSLNFGVNYMAQQKQSTVELNPYGYIIKKEQTTQKSIVSVPLTIQYYFTKGIIRPYLDAGVSIDYLKTDGALDPEGRKTHDQKLGLGVTAALGIEGYITKQFFIKADYRYELYLHYPTLGIAYTFK